MRLIYTTILFAICNVWSANADPIKLAIVGPFSGAYSAYGTQILSGAMQAVNDLNLTGGIRGNQLELIPFDDQCNPDLAVEQANLIVRDHKIHAVIGHVCSAAALATSSIYANANLLVITPSATNPKITQRHFATLFRMIGTDLHQSEIAVNFIANKLHSKRVAVLHDNELYSKDLADLVNENLVHSNITPVLYQAIPRGKKNFNNLVIKLKELEVDAVYFAGLYPEVAALAQGLNTMELQVPLISADAVGVPKFLHSVADPAIASSVILSAPEDPNTLLSSKQVIKNLHHNKIETTGYTLYAYAAVETVAQALDHSNSLEGKVLADWLHQHEVDTVLGKKSWDTNGDINTGNFEIYSWQVVDEQGSMGITKIIR